MMLSGDVATRRSLASRRRGRPAALIGALLVLSLVGACRYMVAPPPVEEVAPTTESLMRLGSTMNAKGDRAAATAFYKQAIATAGDDPETLLKIADTLASFHAKGDALAAYRAALDNAEDDADLHRRVGRSMLAANFVRESIPVLRRASVLDEGNPKILLNLGIALDLAGQSERAVEAYRLGLEAAPEDLDLKSNLALSLALVGNTAPAVRLMQEVMESFDVEDQHYRNMAIVRVMAVQNGEGQQSLGDLEEILAERLGPDEFAKLERQAAWVGQITPASERARAIGTAPP